MLAFVVAIGVAVVAPGAAGASSFSNPSAISIPAQTTASPYPSTISVTGVPGSVVNARATISGISHDTPADLEVLLVAPGGRKTVLMAQACGIQDLTGQTFTFDDAAPAFLSAAGPCPSGTYKPTNNPPGPPDVPPPAPPGPQTTAAMSALNGSPASGTWQLFIEDHANGGSIAGGWSLDLLTDAVCSANTATLTGTAGDDELVGTEGGDVILGFAGNDTIRGLGGNDVICGSEGQDSIRGGTGKDKLVGQAGKDTLRGQGGKDTLLGKGGADKLNGGTGKDVCKGGKKDDTAKKCEVEKSI